MIQELKPYLDRIEKEIDSTLTADQSFIKNSFGEVFSGTQQIHYDQLLDCTKSLVSLGGKRWRPLLLVLTCEAALENTSLSQEEKQKLIENAFRLTPLVEEVHTASLIHDDIEDNSTERRGKPAAYLTYGTDVAINAASWLYFHASSCITSLDLDDSVKLHLFDCWSKELQRLHLGQAMDIYWHRNPDFYPAVEEYMAMVKYKTGTLSSLACKTGAIAARLSAEDQQLLGLTAAQIGAGFQIIDDVINLTTGNAGKNRGDDIVEGKKSLPVLLFIENASNEEKQQLSSYFTQAKAEGIESTAVENAIMLLQGKGVIIKAKEQGISLIEDGCLKLSSLLGKSEKTQFITELFLSMIPDYKEAKKCLKTAKN